MRRLQMAPSHNGSAGRPFPLPQLGRRELATWWWQSCSCWGHKKEKRVLCLNCRRLARSIKCLSKTMWRIDQEGKLTVTAKKNRHLLWWNGRQMMKTSLQLQVGDVISVGQNAETPWLEFNVKRVKAVVTPETDVAKMPSPLSTLARARRISVGRTNPKSRRRLFSGHHRDRNRSGESSLDETDNSHVFSTIVHDTEMGNTDAIMTRDADSEDESPNTYNHATKHTRQEKNSLSSRRKLLLSQDENRSIAATSVIEETQHKQTQPVDKHHAESQESSILSLPQCPTWEDESQNNVGTSSVDSLSAQKPRCHEEARLDRHLRNESKTTPEESSEGPNVLFVSTLSLSQWKQIRQDNDGAASIRGAFARLVVAQKVRDPMWFPAILEGAVLEGDVMEDVNES